MNYYNLENAAGLAKTTENTHKHTHTLSHKHKHTHFAHTHTHINTHIHTSMLYTLTHTHTLSHKHTNTYKQAVHTPTHNALPSKTQPHTNMLTVVFVTPVTVFYFSCQYVVFTFNKCMSRGYKDD